MQTQFTLAQSATTIDGSPVSLQPRSGSAASSSTTLFSAFLTAAGGPATCTVETRMIGGPWVAKATFSLSGANDHSEYILDTENWAECRGRITAIAGGATATIVAGV